MIWVLCSAVGLLVEIVVIIALARGATSDYEEAGTVAPVTET